MTKDIIEINKELIPYDFDILLGGEMFNISVDFNNSANIFTLALKKDGEIVCAGEPLIYGVPLWKDVFISGKYPAIDIIPTDDSEEYNLITYDNLNDTVLLVIQNFSDEV